MPKKFEDLTVEELKDKLAERDLQVSGTKDELIARLRGQAEGAAPPAKRAAKLTYPELADDDWVRGNPAPAKQLTKKAEEN